MGKGEDDIVYFRDSDCVGNGHEEQVLSMFRFLCGHMYHFIRMSLQMLLGF